MRVFNILNMLCHLFILCCLWLGYIYFCVAPGNRFLSGLLQSIAPAKAVVPHLQTVFQADAAHLNFGKYSLFLLWNYSQLQHFSSCNWNYFWQWGQGWLGLFWKFALKHHPCLNDHRITIITDQQKGITESLQGILPKTMNFFYSFHWRQNILQYVKGGKSDYSCHWFYNVLVGCGSMAMIDHKRYELE